ncbi:uncharacterized protein LOC143445287 isoform X1 [Clavelina lepadiformis]|uniref:uncharacterized protein LOC143445286 n=1 Tax=Clavelina lepadiformis TaxID=159417 RepID=UPI0040433042
MYENSDRKMNKSHCLENTPRLNYDRCQHPSFDDHESSTTVFYSKKMWMKIYGRRQKVPFCQCFMRLKTTTPIPCWLLLSMAQMPRLETSTSEDSPSNQKPPVDVGSHDTLHVLRRKMPKQSRIGLSGLDLHTHVVFAGQLHTVTSFHNLCILSIFFGASWKSISLRSLIKDGNSTHPYPTPCRMVTALKHDLGVVIFSVCTQYCSLITFHFLLQNLQT